MIIYKGFQSVILFFIVSVTFFSCSDEHTQKNRYTVEYHMPSDIGNSYQSVFGSIELPVDENLYEEGDLLSLPTSLEGLDDVFFFIGWNTEPDWSGTTYEVDGIIMSQNLTLYPIWGYEPPEPMRVVEVLSSSSLEDDGSSSRYNPTLVLDDNPETSWAEGAEHEGINDFLEIKFETPVWMDQVNIMAGYFHDDWYSLNNRLKEIELQVGEDIFKFFLEDQMTVQQMVLPYGIKAHTLRVIIMDVYKGSSFNDTCIAELDFLFNGHELPLDTSAVISDQELSDSTLIILESNRISGGYRITQWDDFGQVVAYYLSNGIYLYIKLGYSFYSPELFNYEFGTWTYDMDSEKCYVVVTQKSGINGVGYENYCIVAQGTDPLPAEMERFTTSGTWEYEETWHLADTISLNPDPFEYTSPRGDWEYYTVESLSSDDEERVMEYLEQVERKIDDHYQFILGIQEEIQIIMDEESLTVSFEDIQRFNESERIREYWHEMRDKYESSLLNPLGLAENTIVFP